MQQVPCSQKLRRSSSHMASNASLILAPRPLELPPFDHWCYANRALAKPWMPQNSKQQILVECVKMRLIRHFSNKSLKTLLHTTDLVIQSGHIWQGVARETVAGRWFGWVSQTRLSEILTPFWTE